MTDESQATAPVVLLTSKQLRKRLKIGERTLSSWISKGLPVHERGRGGRPSRFDHVAVAAWCARRDEEEKASRAAAKATGAADLLSSAALEDYRQQRCRHAKIEADRLEGGLVAVGSVRLAMGAFYSSLRSEIPNLRGRFGDEVADQVAQGVDRNERLFQDRLVKLARQDSGQGPSAEGASDPV